MNSARSKLHLQVPEVPTLPGVALPAPGRRDVLRWGLGSSLALAVAGGAGLVPAAAAGPEADAGKGPWRMVRNDHGIAVFDRVIPGSAVREFQGTGLIEASIATVMGVLEDTTHRTEWMKEAVAQVPIATEGETQIFYSRTGAPWPVADRDVVLRATTQFDAEARMVRIEFASTTHPQWPPVAKVVRMPFLRGHWYLWPLQGGKWTRAEYQVHAHPGGSIPDWLANRVSKQIPHDTIAALQKQVHRRHYPQMETRLQAKPEYQAVMQPLPPKPASPTPSPSDPGRLPPAAP